MKQKLLLLLKSKTYDCHKISPFFAFSMWFLLLLAHTIFIINWITVLRLEGSASSQSGWVYTFFGANQKGANDIITQAVSYTVSAVRGLISLIIGWIIVKISHKYAVIIAMILLSLALPAIFMPDFYLFIATRLLMALGGSMMIILMQPVISRFFNLSHKRILSLISVQGFVVGSLVSFAFFLDENFRIILLKNWKILAGVIGGLTFIPLIFYLILGRNFNLNIKSVHHKTQLIKATTYLGIAQEPQTLIWSLWHGCWLVIGVLTATFVPSIFIKINPNLNNGFFKFGWRDLFGFIYFLGGLFGFVLSWFTKTKIRRRPLLILLAVIKLILFIIVIISVSLTIFWLLFTSAFVLAFIIFGSHGIYLAVPHEYDGNNPRRLSIFFGYIWGFGYLIFTIVNILTAILLDKVLSPWVAMGFIIFIFVLSIVLTTMIKESHKEYKWLWEIKITKWGSKFHNILERDHYGKNKINKK